MIAVPAAKRMLDLHTVVQIEHTAVFVEQNGHILRHDADHHRAEADVVQRFMRLSAVEDHLGVDLSAAPQRDGLPVFDLKGGHNALKPGHFRLDIGQKREARLIAVRAVCHQFECLRLGGDAVGMSTVTEALTAAHCGLPLLGISVITNMAAGITGEAVSGEEVNETGAAVAERFSRYLEKILEEMDV